MIGREQIFDKEGITLVGASNFRKRDLIDCLDLAPTLVAVDGGANKLHNLGILPNYIVGDLDSVKKLNNFSKKTTEIIHISEQDTTDFDKSLRSFRSKYFLALGFLGNQNDHSLGACSTILRNCNQKVVLIDKHDLIFLMPRKFNISLPRRTRVSLFPFGLVKGIRSKGLKYPIDDMWFSPFGMLGISNETTEEEVEIEIQSRKMLLFLPRKFLGKVINNII